MAGKGKRGRRPTQIPLAADSPAGGAARGLVAYGKKNVSACHRERYQLLGSGGAGEALTEGDAFGGGSLPVCGCRGSVSKGATGLYD